MSSINEETNDNKSILKENLDELDPRILFSFLKRNKWLISKIAAFFIYKDTNDIKSISSEKWLELIK